MKDIFYNLWIGWSHLSRNNDHIRFHQWKLIFWGFGLFRQKKQFAGKMSTCTSCLSKKVSSVFNLKYRSFRKYSLTWTMIGFQASCDVTSHAPISNWGWGWGQWNFLNVKTNTAQWRSKFKTHFWVKGKCLLWVDAGINWLSIGHADVCHSSKGIWCNTDPFLLTAVHHPAIRTTVCNIIMLWFDRMISGVVCFLSAQYWSSTLRLAASVFMHPYCTFSTVECRRWLVTSDAV